MISSEKTYGFRGDMFPILACVIGMSSIAISYFIALHYEHIDPFPKTDITHCGIQFPEYIPFRIGLLAIIPLFIISWNLAKNYLQILSFRFKQQSDPRLNNMGLIGSIASFGLALSTATISDGKNRDGTSDMNWTLHTLGAMTFFVVTLINCLKMSRVYKQLWQYGKFCSEWSYKYKTTVGMVGVGLLAVQVPCWLGVIDLGALVEWLATFYILGYFMSVGADLKHMDLMFVRK